jgi:hypothetical protein
MEAVMTEDRAHLPALKHSHPSFAGVIGVAREDITPPPGIYARNWGAATHDTAEGVHRPLSATVLTLQSHREEAPLVLAALDLGWWRGREDEWALRGALIEEFALDASRVMICLSHTHAGPSICRADSDRPGGALVPAYLQHVQDALLRAVRAALAGSRPATIAWHEGKCALAANRDLRDPQSSRIICGWSPDKAADDTLLVGRVTDDSGQPLATLVNYACHPTTLAWQNRQISPDYIGAMREVVEAQSGAPCLFLQGASGELAPREQYVGDASVADAHGRELGHAALVFWPRCCRHEPRWNTRTSWNRVLRWPSGAALPRSRRNAARAVRRCGAGAEGVADIRRDRGRAHYGFSAPIPTAPTPSGCAQAADTPRAGR